MKDDVTKKAIDMLLGGATLVGEPCPYCKGVRVIKDGHALCVSCGKEPEEAESPEKKLARLGRELEGGADPKRRKEILESMSRIMKEIGGADDKGF